MNMGVLQPLLPRSSSRTAGKLCTAWIHPPMHDMMPYQVLAVCADCGLLVCAQEVDLSQNLRSVPRFMRLGDRLQPAGQRDV